MRSRSTRSKSIVTSSSLSSPLRYLPESDSITSLVVRIPQKCRRCGIGRSTICDGMSCRTHKTCGSVISDTEPSLRLAALSFNPASSPTPRTRASRIDSPITNFSETSFQKWGVGLVLSFMSKILVSLIIAATTTEPVTGAWCFKTHPHNFQYENPTDFLTTIIHTFYPKVKRGIVYL